MVTDRIKLEEILKKYMLKDGSGRRDICPVYRDKDAMDQMVAYLAEPYRGKVDYVVSPESLGFILGSRMAAELGVGFIPIRNGNIAVLPTEDSIRAAYIDHRNSVRSLQVRKSNLPEGCKVLLVDDWVETAATIQTCMTIIEEVQGTVQGIVSLGVNYNEATQKMVDTGMSRSIIINRFL